MNNDFKKQIFFDDHDERKISIELDDGAKKEGIIIFTFHNDDFEYILYELDDFAYAAKITSDNALLPIDDDEWNLIEKIYDEFQEEMEKGIEN
ncbi:MAG: DUF1292 domain-containing protein [Mycoplasma sp.]|nr:DUF1292 domain-containing protein [Mycoplasma sp.]